MITPLRKSWTWILALFLAVLLPTPLLQLQAQTPPRKLALLVGTNKYQGDGLNLKGPENDIELVPELLTRKYGFKQEDIKVLKGKQVSRANVLAVFKNHLIKQANPRDVVVFHYSGHGAQVKDVGGISRHLPRITGGPTARNATASTTRGGSRLLDAQPFLARQIALRGLRHISRSFEHC